MTEKDFYIKLGQQVRERREELGMKQKELADKAGISPAVLGRFENRGKKLSAFRIANIFKTLGEEPFGVKKNSISAYLSTD